MNIRQPSATVRAPRPRARGRTVGSLLALALLVGVLAGTSGAAVATAATPTGWIRFAHFAPSQAPVDIWVDGSVVLKDSSFKSVSSYLALPVGPHAVAVRPTGSPSTAPTVVAGTAVVSASTATTAAIVEVDGTLTLEMLTDDLSPPPAGQAKLRIIQSAPSLGVVSGTLRPTTAATPGTTTPVPAAQQSSSTTVQIPPVGFASASPYVAVPGGRYQVAVSHAGSSNPVVMGADLPVTAGSVVSVIVLGATTGPTIEVLSDAVGASTMPVGAMHTGFGGTAGGSSGPGSSTPSLVLAAGGLLLLGGLLRRRSRRTRVGTPS